MLHARRRVSGLLDGQYASVQAGRSLDFSDLRSYVPGDDVADIDWKASARHGDLLVKRFVADRKHTVVLVVDTGREMSALAAWHDAGGDTKREVAITVAGLIGWIAVRHGDYVALVCRTPDGPTVRRPTTRELELERMLEAVQEHCRADAPPQNTEELLDYAATVLRRRALMVLVLGDVEPDAALESRLRRLQVQHELIVLTIADLDPTQLAGHRIRDVGTGRAFPGFAARSRTLAAEITAADAARNEARVAMFSRMGIPYAHLREPAQGINDVLALLERGRRVR